MKYIKNNKKYAVSFYFLVDTKEFHYTFDCFRAYADTGNIASTGVTPIDDANYSMLKNCPQFNAMIESGELSISKNDGVLETAGKMEQIAKENEELKTKLAEITAMQSNGGIDEILKENKSMKEKLEALGKENNSEAGKKGKKANKDEF